MRDSVYLTFDRNGVILMRKRAPAMSSGEFAVRISIEVPDQFFNRVIPHAHIEVPEDFILEPEVEVTLEGEPSE